MASEQISLRMNEKVVEAARRAAERENRSLANLIETVLIEYLTIPTPATPTMSVVDNDEALRDAVAIDDDGNVDAVETERFRDMARPSS